ncbi:hypothetical protein HDV00_002977 [Rhizophlyctis rosea]|nr:hypothetical protein HDV00_002977 [Rhizophlyctis rosea]
MVCICPGGRRCRCQPPFNTPKKDGAKQTTTRKPRKKPTPTPSSTMPENTDNNAHSTAPRKGSISGGSTKSTPPGVGGIQRMVWSDVSFDKEGKPAMVESYYLLDDKGNVAGFGSGKWSTPNDPTGEGNNNGNQREDEANNRAPRWNDRGQAQMGRPPMPGPDGILRNAPPPRSPEPHYSLSASPHRRRSSIAPQQQMGDDYYDTHNSSYNYQQSQQQQQQQQRRLPPAADPTPSSRPANNRYRPYPAPTTRRSQSPPYQSDAPRPLPSIASLIPRERPTYQTRKPTPQSSHMDYPEAPLNPTQMTPPPYPRRPTSASPMVPYGEAQTSPSMGSYHDRYDDNGTYAHQQSTSNTSGTNYPTHNYPTHHQPPSPPPSSISTLASVSSSTAATQRPPQAPSNNSQAPFQPPSSNVMAMQRDLADLRGRIRNVEEDLRVLRGVAERLERAIEGYGGRG